MAEYSRETKTTYTVHHGWDECGSFDKLKDARELYRKLQPDFMDGVFIRREVVETTTLSHYTTIQSKSE